MDDKMYVIKNNETNKWIAIDSTSGGYPYDTEIHNAKIFYDKKSALNYKNVMKGNWSLFQLQVHGIPVSWENKSTVKTFPF